jgi:hypothetical protein
MFRATKHQQNDRKYWKNLRTHQWRLSPNNPWAHRHHWEQLWSLPGDVNRKFEHAPHCSFITTMHPPTHPWKPQSLWLTVTWLSSHPPYSLDVAPCDFALFPKLKMKLKGWHLKQCLTSKGNLQWYPTALRKMTSTVILKRGKKRWDRCIRSQRDHIEGDHSQNWVS